MSSHNHAIEIRKKKQKKKKNSWFRKNCNTDALSFKYGFRTLDVKVLHKDKFKISVASWQCVLCTAMPRPHNAVQIKSTHNMHISHLFYSTSKIVLGMPFYHTQHLCSLVWAWVAWLRTIFEQVYYLLICLNMFYKLDFVRTWCDSLISDFLPLYSIYPN